jgi:hypothetical protein
VDPTQLLKQPDAEITKLMHVTEDVLKHHQLHQMHVIAVQLQFKNVEMDQLQEQLLAEIMLKQHVNKNVLQ